MHWMRDWPNPHALFVRGANGAQIECVDGQTYFDFCLGDTAAMFGHSPPALVQALHTQAQNGMTCMLPSHFSAQVGARLSEIFGLAQWQLALSASDANRFVLRWARAITQRRVLLVFDGCYHGAVDDTLVDRLDRGQVIDRPSALGSVHSHAETTRVIPFNDLTALQAALADGQVAALLAEPALTNCGLVLPDAGFWTQALEMCRRHGTLLVLDETHTLSSACGGWARAHGLQPDLLVMGKAIAGGLPCAVYGFTHEVAKRMRTVKEQSPAGHSGIGTTLSANLLTMAALQASLKHLHTRTNYAHMLDLAQTLADGLMQRIRTAQLPWTVTRLGARLELQFMPHPPRQAADVRAAHATQGWALEPLLHLFMLNRGVVLTPFHCMMLVSPITQSTHVQHLLAVFDEFVQTLMLPLPPKTP